MTNATCSNRPRKYHRSGGPWQRVLVVLARHCWPDYLIAECLQDLSPDALASVNRLADPRPDDVEALRETDAGRRWTERQVEYHRRRLRIRSRYKKYWHIKQYRIGMRIARIPRKSENSWEH